MTRGLPLLILACCVLCYQRAFTGLSQSPRKLRSSLAAVLDRSDACKTLGLRDVVGSFTADELKRAYRTAVRMAHPDAPGGSAQKLQKVKEAYDFLAAAPDVKVWDEGRRSYGAGGVGSTPQPKKPKPDAMRREVILGGIGGATLLSIAIASQVVSTDKRDAYLKQYVGEDAVELRDGLGDSKKLPPVVANGRFVRGQEYIRTGEVAVNCRCQVLLLGDFLPSEIGSASPVRAFALTKLLGTVLEASSDNERLYKSVTAVISQNDLNLVARELRQLESQGADIREPRSPYLFFGGGAVLRFQKDEPEQELLLVPAQRLFVASSDVDPLGPKTLAEANRPNLIVFDLTKQQWDDLKDQFARVAGNYVPASEVDSPELLSALKAALVDEKKPESEAA